MSTPNPLNPSDIETAARALLDSRVTAVRELARTRQAVADAQKVLTDAQREDAQVFAAAQRAGWSHDELKKLGFEAPAVRPPGRPRAAASRAGSASTSTDPGGPGGPGGAAEPGA